MGMLRVAGIVSLLVVGQVMAESQVNFTLGLQPATGSYAAYVAGYPGVLYPAGSQLDGQVFPLNSKITWDMTLEAFGIQAAGNGAGYEIQGVANFVYDLELHAGTAEGPLVAAATFMSDINTGSPLASAAFARSMNLFDLGPGRVIDGIMDGGPLMGTYTYPTNPSDGTLLGMGAGYSSWSRTGLTLTTAGVGIEGGLMGLVPVTEGQIDLTGLPVGIYVLKCVSGAGVNVLRGDVDLMQDQNAFAVAADLTDGDTITFEIQDGGISLVSAASRRTHGSDGAFDVALLIDGTPGIEPRKADAGSPQVVLTYSSAPADPGCAAVTIVNGTCTVTSVDGNDLVIDLSYSANTCVEVTVGADTVRILAHQGNVNGDADVNVIDLQDVKNHVFEAVDASNAKYDVAADGGSINVIDLQDTKNNVFAPIPSCD